MKMVRVESLAVMMNVSDGYDHKEVQEHLDLLNLHLRGANPGGQILGIDNLSDDDIVEEN